MTYGWPRQNVSGVFVSFERQRPGWSNQTMTVRKRPISLVRAFPLLAVLAAGERSFDAKTMGLPRFGERRRRLCATTNDAKAAHTYVIGNRSPQSPPLGWIEPRSSARLVSKGELLCAAVGESLAWYASGSTSALDKTLVEQDSESCSCSLMICPIGKRFPSTTRKFPCSKFRECRDHIAGFAGSAGRDYGVSRASIAIFPVNSLVAGNPLSETGSPMTAHTTIIPLLRQSARAGSWRRG